MGDLGIEDLPSALARLIQHFAAVTGVGVVAEVLALIHKPSASAVDQNAERIRVFLEVVANVQVAEFRGVHVPAHSVAARPVAARSSPDVHCHAYAVAGVEPRAAYLRQIPSRAEITRPPCGVRLEAAAGNHDRVSAHRFSVNEHIETARPTPQAGRPTPVANVDTRLRRNVAERVYEARSATPRLDGQATPKPHSLGGGTRSHLE